MTAKEFFCDKKRLDILVLLAVIASGFVTYKIWPLRERVSVAEQKIKLVCEDQKEFKINQKELIIAQSKIIPTLENIQRQLDQHQKNSEVLDKQMREIEKLMAKIEGHLK